jgi:hypothetical protein
VNESIWMTCSRIFPDIHWSSVFLGCIDDLDEFAAFSMSTTVITIQVQNKCMNSPSVRQDVEYVPSLSCL